MSTFTISGIEIPLDIKPLPAETLQLAAADSRIVAEDILALSACPPHSESLRDGYALAPRKSVSCHELPQQKSQEGGGEIYSVAGEIAAGTRIAGRLQPGSACRIFTGAMIPEGAERVVPQEECREVAGRVQVAAAALATDRLFINKSGSEVACGATVVRKGTRLEIDHLTLLAAVGVHQVRVVTRPRVACFCTGSELVAVGEVLEAGQKLSLNSMLLQNLIPRYGGVVAELGIISDNQQDITKIFSTLRDERCDLVISTGGMGPGKYDLVKDAFCGAGGKIILESLPMFPGRSILLGTFGNTVFIALPGPPNAVRTLVNELVGPVLLMMQGAKHCWPKALQARLLDNCRVRKSDLLQLKGGVLSLESGNCMVRPAERLDPVSCFILFPAGRKEFFKGDVVEVHLSATTADSVIFHF
ncbi:MAG: molybdopterin molybdotransferase MoeA [Proteobacteria bacterium]|nr:molybdopterin molybdotransferase MoeA [Pseudomonadota bacterium]